MRKWITLLMTLLVGATVSYANADVGQVTFEAGYRRDNIDWKTRLPANDPTAKLTTKFKDLDIFQIGLQGRTTVGGNFYVRANAYWGWILDGDFEQHVKTYFSPYSTGYGNFDVGFANDHHNVIDDKYVYGVGAAIGYPFYFCDCSVVLAPVVGYAFDEQNIEIDDEGFNFVDNYDVFFPVSGSDCCRHKWISKWYGPFVGVDFNYRPYNECWSLYAEFEYHWGSFKGKRHINDISGGLDMNQHKFHSNRAHAWVVSAGADYDICNNWTVGIGFKFQDWSANRHHRRDDYNSGFSGGRERQNYKWHSGEVKLALGREF